MTTIINETLKDGRFESRVHATDNEKVEINLTICALDRIESFVSVSYKNEFQKLSLFLNRQNMKHLQYKISQALGELDRREQK